MVSCKEEDYRLAQGMVTFMIGLGNVRSRVRRAGKRKLKKKIRKLSKKRKVAKRKEPNKIVKAIENLEKRIEQEKRHLEGIK